MVSSSHAPRAHTLTHSSNRTNLYSLSNIEACMLFYTKNFSPEFLNLYNTDIYLTVRLDFKKMKKKA